MLNEHLASSKALSNHLLQILKKQDAQQAGTLPLALLVATLQSLSQDCLGLNNLTLACIVGHACSQVGEPVKYEAWVPAAAAMMYSMLDFSTASVCHAAVGEFRGKDESQKGRSAGVEGVQVRISLPALLAFHEYQLHYNCASWFIPYLIQVSCSACMRIQPAMHAVDVCCTKLWQVQLDMCVPC